MPPVTVHSDDEDFVDLFVDDDSVPSLCAEESALGYLNQMLLEEEELLPIVLTAYTDPDAVPTPGRKLKQKQKSCQNF